MVWHAGLLHKHKSCGILQQVLKLIYLFGNRQFLLVSDGKPWQEYLVNTDVPPGSALGVMLFLLHINDLPDYIITITTIKFLICNYI